MCNKYLLVTAVYTSHKNDGFPFDQAKFEESIDKNSFIFFFSIYLILGKL